MEKETDQTYHLVLSICYAAGAVLTLAILVWSKF
jgi:hypothetical protein